MPDPSRAPASTPPKLYARVARWLADAAGSAIAAVVLLVSLGLWLLVGARTDWPRWWELVITVGFPFLTLGLLIVIQHTQTHGNRALHVKLDEIICSHENASEEVVQVEHASEDDLDEYRRRQDARRVSR